MNLQPLKIPSGWTVEWNLLSDKDPTLDNIHEFTGSSLLLINSFKRLKAIDVSWRPEADIHGSFLLQVIHLLPYFNNNSNTIEFTGVWEEPELEFTTKNRLVLVEKINHLLFTLKPYKDSRILIKPGVVDEQHEAIRQEMLSQGLTKSVVTKILNSNHKELQNLMLDHRETNKSIIELLAIKGANKGVINKAKQILNSKKFKPN